MNDGKNKNETRKKVFGFYADHQSDCDKYFEIAEAENIGELYDDVNDRHVQNTLFTQTSIVILTANKYERNILHKKIYELNGKHIQRIEIKLFTACQRFKKAYAYWFEWGGYSVLNIHANVTGSYTIGGSADIIRWVLLNEYLFPTAIISFGVCFGTKLRDNEQLGDVIISRKIYPYFIGAKINGKEIRVVDDNAFHVADDLNNKILDLDNNNKFNKCNFDVKFKNYITGEAVVSSKVFRDKFVNITTQEIFAGEMEGYGLFKECTSSPYNIPCVIIKSICDWADEKNFDVNDDNILEEFKATLQENESKKNIEKEILKTLKDRLQSYSANCAFEALAVVIQNHIFKNSLLDDVREWIKKYQGAATSCRRFQEEIIKTINKFNLGYEISDSYVHRCIIILEGEGIIRCSPECNLSENKNDKCIKPNKTASIDIIQVKE